MKVALVVGILALSISPPAAAQTVRLSPESRFATPTSPGLQRTAQEALRRAQEKLPQTFKTDLWQQKPRVVCGMVMIPADPKLDAAIRHPAPSEDGLKFTLQRVVPAVCRQ